MSVSTIFGIYSAIFAILLIGSGIIARKWVSEADDFIIAGREIGFLVNMLGVVAIGFAGTSITLAPGFTIMYGFKGGALWGIIYSLLGLMFYANVFAKFIRRNGSQTLPEFFEMRYNSKVRSVVSITTVIGLTGILANNIVSMSQIVSSYTGWNPAYVVGAAFLIILIFATMSGMWATTITDFIQVTIGTVAVPVFLYILWNKFGGSSFFSGWPQGDWVNNGINSMTMPGLSLKYPSILTFILCFGAALVWGNNYYWIKMSSCRNEKVAKKSYTAGSIYLIIVFMIPLALIGVFAGTEYAESFTLLGGKILPTAAYGVMAKSIIPALGSLFIVGASAAALSTSSTAALGATATATRDIYKNLINKNADANQNLKASRVIMLLIIVLTWFMTFFPGGPAYLFAFANAWLTPPAVLLMLGAFWPRFNSKGAVAGVISGMIVMVVLTILDLTKIFSIGKWTHIAIFGFVVSLVVGVIVALSSKPEYYGEHDWNVDPNKGKRQNIKLEGLEIEALKMIYIGHNTMADIIDGLKLDAPRTGEIIKNLDLGGYIIREGLKGYKFYTFRISPKGKEFLQNLPDQEKKLAEIHLNKSYVDFLQLISKTSEHMGSFAKENNISSLQMSSIISHLERVGYIKQFGTFRRKVQITDTGSKALSQALSILN